MSARSTRNARMVFAAMVPLTVGAFLLGSLAESSIMAGAPDFLEIAALVVVTIGVWMYNWFEEKP